MTISILMPVFNAGPFLQECLESIGRQRESKWELLAVDDFSTDDSLEILEAFAEKDSRIKVFQNVEKGIIPALRLAFEKSSGEFITRMDADDRMMPTKLLQLKSLLLQFGGGHVSTGLVQYFSETGLGEGYRRYENWLNELTKTARNFEEIYKECVIPSPCWMVWRKDLFRCGAFEPDTCPEDYDLCFRFYKNRLRVLGSDEILHLWRDHPGRTSRTDDRYSNNQYFDLKLPFFLDEEYDPSRPLVLWGAGRKGKRLAKMLHDQQLPFYWLCNNPAKWGIELFGTNIQNYELLPQLQNPQLIIAVAAPQDQKEILEYLHQHGLKPGAHYFLFC